MAYFREIKNGLNAINWRTIYINFKYFPLKDAIRFPILVHRKTRVKLSGSIEIVGKLYTGMIRIGFGEIGIFDRKYQSNLLQIEKMRDSVRTGKMIFHGRARIGRGSKISIGANGVLELGNNFNLTAESSIVCVKKITFGENCLISWDCLFMDTDFHKIMNEDNAVINEPKEINIGNNVWFGCRCLILKGTKIKDGSIIGANSTVAKKLETENSIYAGNSVKCVKKKVKWKA